MVEAPRDRAPTDPAANLPSYAADEGLATVCVLLVEIAGRPGSRLGMTAAMRDPCGFADVLSPHTAHKIRWPLNFFA